LGPREGAEVRIFPEPFKEKDVPRRHRKNPRRPESTLGQVAESAQGLDTQAETQADM